MSTADVVMYVMVPLACGVISGIVVAIATVRYLRVHVVSGIAYRPTRLVEPMVEEEKKKPMPRKPNLVIDTHFN
jgi:hypothetical protein